MPGFPQTPVIGQKPEGDILDFLISGQSFIIESCHNSRTSSNIDTKLGPVIKLDKRNTTTSKKLTIVLYGWIVTLFPIFLNMTNLQPSGKWILDAWSITFTSSWTITFHLTKTEITTEKSLTKVWYYCFK